MGTYILRRTISAFLTLFVIITISFFLIRLAPGGPFDLERPLEAKVMENLARIYKLDRSLFEQYLLYLQALLQGDFGPSFINRDFSVNELFRTGLPVSAMLGASAILIALLFGVTLGTVAAFRQNTIVDYLVTGWAAFGITIPGFVVGPTLQLLVLALAVGGTATILPIGGWDGPASMVLPVIVLALPQTAVIGRMIRASMIEVLHSNHIRTLRAMGLPTRVVVGHALRGAILPVITYLGPAAASLLTGSVVVETIFTIPGIGTYFVTSALNRDYTVVMGTVVVVAVFVLLFNLIVDILYAFVDPRVRFD